VRAIVGNALKILPDFFAWLPPDAVCYCDPPYMLPTRTKQLLYSFHQSDELSDDDHSTLLVLLQAKCRVLVSGYPSNLYSWQLSGVALSRIRDHDARRETSRMPMVQLPGA